jgi:hypothetical protein
MRIGPRPSGPRWTGEDDALLLAMIESKTSRLVIARRLKRSQYAIQTRIKILRRKAEDLGASSVLIESEPRL